MDKVKSVSCERNLVDLYFEFTSKDFSVAANEVRQKGQHLCDRFQTRRMFRVSGCNAGCYLAYDLHKTPHYQLPYNMRSIMENDATKKGIIIEKVDTSVFEEKDYLYHYSDKSAIYIEKIHPRINDFQVNHVIEMLDKERVCSRGNLAKSIGWRTLDYEYNTDDKINIPTRHPMSAYDRSILKIMTSLLQEIFSDRIEPLPFSGDDVRRKKFAESLLEVDGGFAEDEGSNCFESMTYAMSYVGEKDHLLAPHIDHFNCKTKGYNMVFSVYFHAKHPTKKNTIVRVVFIGYSRRQMQEYFHRISLRHVLKKNLLKYSSLLGTRNVLKIENAFPYTKEGSHKFFYSIPFTDKCAFYSIFTSAIYDLTKVFHDAKKPITSDDILEMALPIVWLPTGFFYYQIIKEWESTKILPEYNLTMAVVDSIVQRSGGLSKGNGQRFMPFCNKPIPKNEIINSLRKLRIILHESKTENWSSNELLHGIKNAVYCCGDIGAQHLMSVLTLLQVIGDTKFVRDAVVLKNTRTEKRLKKLYKMSHHVINELYKELANELYDGNLRMVENLTCEFFRDMGTKTLYGVLETDYQNNIRKRIDSTIRHPDVFHSTQSLFVEENSIVNRYYYNDQGMVKKEKVNTFYVNKTEKVWILNTTPLYSAAEIIQVKKEVAPDVTTPTTTKSKRANTYHENDDLPDKYINDDTNFSTKHQHIRVQWKKYKGRDFIPSDKFIWKNSWFNGYFKKISVEQIVKSLTNAKRMKKKQKIIHITNAFTSDNRNVFTASIKTNNQQKTLSSKIEKLPTNGYYESLPTSFSNKIDIVSYYNTDSCARNAMIVYVLALSGYNLSSVSLFNSYKGEKNVCVALFETIGKGKHSSSIDFVCLLWSDNDANFSLDFPNENDLFDAWTSYPISL